MNDLNQKLNQYFPGKVVRKDLTKQIREGVNVPVFVLEYLLGMYCATDDEETIREGVQRVKDILADNYVRPDEAEKVKARIREKGRYKVIDKVTAKLNERLDRYEAALSSLGIQKIPISDQYIKRFEKLLAGGVWCILTLVYYYDENSADSPFIIDELKPIQMPGLDMEELFQHRQYFSKDEWMEVLIRSVGMEPANLDPKARWHFVARLIPFVENNYNLCELGPRGTGKSYVYDEISPNAILISGGQTTVANLFYNMSTRQVGLVGLWDIVAFDEVAGIKFKDKDGIQIMKGYMANGSFARGKEHVNANASMVLVGNINSSIENLVKTSHLFAPFPDEMIDSAFFDRIHHYLPGWEIPKLRPEMLTDQYGFISDYLAEWMREMRKRTYADAIFQYFRLGKDLNQRDTIAVKRTVSGLIKLLYPDGNFSKADIQECLEYALMGRRRVKEQLKKIGGMEFYDVHFSLIDLESREEKFIGVPESGGNRLIPEGELPPGTVYTIGSNPDTGHKGLFKLELQIMTGNGKFSHTGFGGGKAIRDELKEAVNYFKANLSKVSQNARYSDHDFHLKATDLNGIGDVQGIELAIFVSLTSGALDRPLLTQSVILGSMSIGGAVISTPHLGDALQISADSGAKKVILPAIDMAHIAKVPGDIISRFSLIVYTDPIGAVYKGLGVE
ncbi:MAG: protease Lon-related BREX system protein BrxL [Calditrichaceae bacterium]|nr:protease Lon-related BREX system protein BrxL [Calditrichia bacterium]NUQ43060.1 protease Lon-related BREX system protein BrxL [Calditrichaceae bacterium]